MSTTLLTGDCRTVLDTLPAQSVQCVVTSPPYFNQRDYQHRDQVGHEPTISEYVETLVDVFRAVHRVLRQDGIAWLNIGDSYATAGGAAMQGKSGQRANRRFTAERMPPRRELPAKNLLLIPARLSIALQDDGWIVRSVVIWHKPNSMIESVRDRPTTAHEYVYLLSKQGRYFYDADAIAEPITASTLARINQPTLALQAGSVRQPGKTNGPMKAVVRKQDALGHRRYTGANERYFGAEQPLTRNKRSVWTIATSGFKDNHFATFPENLVEPCILAGSRAGDTVLDPFSGAGTVALVAERLGRSSIGIELNPDYVAIARKRLNDWRRPLFAEAEPA